MTKQEVFKSCISNADCGNGHEKAVPFKAEDVAEVIHAQEYCCCGWGEAAMCKSWCDSGSVAVVKLKDGKYGTVWEDSDTSGHG